MYNMDDVISGRLSNVKEVNSRIPFIAEGFHESLIVVSIERYTDRKLVEAAAGYEQAGLSVRVILQVEKSTVHAPGTLVTKTWNLFKANKFPNNPNDADKWVDFVCQLQGIKPGQHQASMQAMLKTRGEGGQLEAQIARGVRITATGTAVGKPNEKTGQRYVEVSWQTYKQQDPNLVAQTRAQLDQQRPYIAQEQQSAPAQLQPPTYTNMPHTVNSAPQGFGTTPPTQLQQAANQMYQVTQPVQPLQQTQAAPVGGFLALLPNK